MCWYFLFVKCCATQHTEITLRADGIHKDLEDSGDNGHYYDDGKHS